MKIRLLAVVVTYYPEMDLLRRNLSAVIDEVDKVLIWENTPEKDKLQYRMEPSTKIDYSGDGVNSISRGLNQGWKYAKENGYDYLLLLDQDSEFHNLHFYLDKTIRNPKAPMGIWGPEVNAEKASHEFVEKDTCITSGMLLSTSLIDKIGGWDELFRIDSVDLDFCLRASLLGIKTYIVKDASLKQRFGRPKIVTSHGRNIMIKDYPPSRLYTYYLEIFVLKKKHPDSQFVKKAFRKRMRATRKIMHYEPDKIRKAIAIVKGILAGSVFLYFNSYFVARLFYRK